MTGVEPSIQVVLLLLLSLLMLMLLLLLLLLLLLQLLSLLLLFVIAIFVFVCCVVLLLVTLSFVQFCCDCCFCCCCFNSEAGLQAELQLSTQQLAAQLRDDEAASEAAASKLQRLQNTLKLPKWIVEEEWPLEQQRPRF